MTNLEKEIIRLRVEEKLSVREIGEIVGFSRTQISNILNSFGISGHLPQPLIPLYPEYTDEELSTSAGVPISKIEDLRRNREKETPVKLYNRRNAFVRILFGEEYKPGVNFSHWLYQLATENLSPRRVELIVDFYVTGKNISLSANINSDTSRVYRANARKLLKEIVSTYEISKLLESRVICLKK